MKVYIATYALTEGILELEKIDKHAGDVRVISTSGGSVWVRSGYWYNTREEAIKKAESMRANKIAGLKKQIIKLEELRFK